jgi:hypothetical protein
MQNSSQTNASQGPELTQYRLGRFNVVATFPNMHEARTAMESLGRAGIEGQRITLRGPAPDTAASEPVSPADNARADAAVFRRWLPVVLGGATTGSLIGAVLGVPVGFIVLSLIGEDVSFVSIAIASFMGSIFGAFIGGLIANMAPEVDSQAWELSFHDDGAEEMAVVGVHTDDPKDVERARDVFDKLGALDVRDLGQASAFEAAALARTR